MLPAEQPKQLHELPAGLLNGPPEPGSGPAVAVEDSNFEPVILVAASEARLVPTTQFHRFEYAIRPW